MGNESNEKASVVVINGVREEKIVIETIIGTNAETGEAIAEYKVQNGFDGMTGEPVYVPVVQDGFDGETGKPVFVEKTADVVTTEVAPEIEVETATVSYEAEPVSEDVTAVSEPVYEDYSQNQAESTEVYSQYQPADVSTYDDATTKKKKPGIIIAIAAIVAVILIGIAVFGALKGGLFMSPANKVALATANTLKESSIVETLMEASAFTNQSELTSTMEGSVSAYGTNVDFEATTAQDIKAGKIGAEGKVDIAGITDQTFKFYYDDKKIQFAVPDIYDDVFVYDYSSSSNGYIAELIEDETDGDIDDLNALLKAANELYKNSEKYRTKLAAEMAKVYAGIEVEKIGSEEFEVDGKDRKCKGYTVTITEDDIQNFVKAYIKATEDSYGPAMKDFMEAASNLSGEDIDYDEIMDEMNDELGDFDDLSFDVFIYKGKLAAIETKIDGERIKIEFKGGDKRISEIEVSVGKERVVIKDKDRNGKETISVGASGFDVFDCSYNKESGKISFSVAGGKEYDAVFQVEPGKKVKVGFSGKIEGVDMDIKVETVKGAKIKEIKGDVFDLGDADEDDFEDLAYEISSEVMSMMGMGGSSYGYDDYDYDDDFNPFDLSDY